MTSARAIYPIGRVRLWHSRIRVRLIVTKLYSLTTLSLTDDLQVHPRYWGHQHELKAMKSTGSKRRDLSI